MLKQTQVTTFNNTSSCVNVINQTLLDLFPPSWLGNTTIDIINSVDIYTYNYLKQTN